MSIQIKNSNTVINFYDELYKSLDNDDDEKDNNNECLITLLPLTENAVTLKCGHKFNYEALYDEIYNQKYVLKKYDMADQKYRKFLQKNLYFIKCPYCRELQTELLPYLPELKSELCYGINTDDLTYEKYDKFSCYNHALSSFHPIHSTKTPVKNCECEWSKFIEENKLTDESTCSISTQICTNPITKKNFCTFHYNKSLLVLQKKYIRDKKMADKQAKLDAIKKCNYVMKTGNKCTCKAIINSDFCGKHKPKTPLPNAPYPLCVAITKKGTPCGCKAADLLALLCNRHKPKVTTNVVQNTI